MTHAHVSQVLVSAWKQRWAPAMSLLQKHKPREKQSGFAHIRLLIGAGALQVVVSALAIQLKSIARGKLTLKSNVVQTWSRNTLELGINECKVEHCRVDAPIVLK